MFRVECSSCKAPYQVDERRVPKKGLTMKCPKCQASFLVSPPDAPAVVPAVAPAAVPLPRHDLRGTMIGVTAQSRSASGPVAGVSSLSGPDAPLPAVGSSTGASFNKQRSEVSGFTGARSARNDETMIGIAPEKSGGRSTPWGSGAKPAEPVRSSREPAHARIDPDLPDDLPTTRASSEGLKINTTWPRSEANTKDTAVELPALKREAAKPDQGFSPVSGRKLSRINLPSLQSRPGVAARASTPPTATRESSDETSSAVAATSAPSRLAAVGPSGVGQPSTSASNLYKPTQPEVTRPESPTAGAGPAMGAGLGARSSAGADALVDADDLPAPVTKLGRSASDEFSFELDLPSIRVSENKETDAAPSSTADLPEVPLRPESELPAALGGALGGAGWVSISAPASTSAPAQARHDSLIDLDSEGVSLESLPPSEPPSSVGPDLPEVALTDAQLPNVSVSGLPSRPAPNFEDAGLGFGELDLPPLDSIPASGEGRPSQQVGVKFTGTEPPDLHTSPAPPSFRARRDSFGDFDGLPSFDEGSLRPPSSVGVSDEDELDDGESLALDRETPHHPNSSDRAGRTSSSNANSERQSQSAGSANEEYGQVHLDAGADESNPLDDEMEFGGIPQADAEAPAPAGSEPAAPLPERASPHPVAVRNARRPHTKTKKRWVISAAVVVPLLVGGAALSLEPRLGPFGIHAVEGLLNRGQHEALLKKHVDMVSQRRAMDQYATAVEGVSLLDQARLAAKRYVPLQLAAAEAHLSLALRFGGPASSQSAGQVLLGELKADGVDTAELRLAEVLDTALQGSIDAARAKLAGLPTTLHTLAIQGELALRANDADSAIAAWVQAVELKRCPWTLYGLARAHFVAGQYEAATTAGRQVLEGNSLHAGAKLLLAEMALAQGRPDQKTADLINEVLADSTLASPAELALAHTLTGELELGHGRTGKALEALEQALELEPNSARALTSSGRAMFASGRYTTALARYQAAQSVEPDRVGAALGVVRSHLALQQVDKAKLELAPLNKTHGNDLEVASLTGAVALAEGDAESAQKILRDAVERVRAEQTAPPRMTHLEYQRVVVEAYVALAAAYTKSAQPEQATAVLQQAMKQLPGSARLRTALGDVSLSQGQFDRALANYSEARQLAPQDVEAVFKVGVTLRRLGRFEEAGSVLERVAKMDAQYPGLALERGLLLEQSGKSEEALAQYEQALKSAPDDGDIQLRVGCSRVLAGNGQAAEEMLEKLVQTRPRSAEVNYCLGRAHFVQGNNLEALRWLRSAVELDGNRPEYRLYVGWVANELGQVPLALTELNRALELDQSLTEAYWQRGVLNLKQGAARDATYDFKKALALAPDNAAVNADMGQALVRLTREGEAIGYWEKAIAAEPDNPLWLYRYGKVLVGRHHRTKAASLLRKAIQLGNKQEPKPVWLSHAHYLTGVALKGSPEALEHWRAYLETSPPDDSVYRDEAERELKAAE